MDYATAKTLAQEWCDAWNSKDLAKILTHYADEIVLYSPYALKRLGDASKGKVQGKELLGKYFSIGLQAAPELNFQLVDVLLGIDEVTILYRRETGILVADSMSFNDKNQAKTVRAFYAQTIV
jgi:hypothetical protein